MSNRVAQMYERHLEPIKGYWDEHALTKARPLVASLLNSATAVPAGRVAHIDSTGGFDLGGAGTEMPLYLWAGKNEPDIYNDGVSSVTGTTHWWGISPSGVMNALVATGGYELQTTEFDTTKTYVANELLTASASGVMTNASVTQYTTWVCGITSWFEQAPIEASAATGPVGTNAHGVSVLTFWSYFLPASAQ